MPKMVDVGETLASRIDNFKQERGAESRSEVTRRALDRFLAEEGY